jgi:hypothetical protein
MVLYRVTPIYRVIVGCAGAGVTHDARLARVAQDTDWPRTMGMVQIAASFQSAAPGEAAAVGPVRVATQISALRESGWESAKKVGGTLNQMLDADRNGKRPSEADGCYRLLTSKEDAVIEAGFDDRR